MLKLSENYEVNHITTYARSKGFAVYGATDHNDIDGYIVICDINSDNAVVFETDCEYDDILTMNFSYTSTYEYDGDVVCDHRSFQHMQQPTNLDYIARILAICNPQFFGDITSVLVDSTKVCVDRVYFGDLGAVIVTDIGLNTITNTRVVVYKTMWTGPFSTLVMDFADFVNAHTTF